MRGLFVFLVALGAGLVFWAYLTFFHVPYHIQLQNEYVKQCVDSMLYYKRALSIQHATDQCQYEAELKYPETGDET